MNSAKNKVRVIKSSERVKPEAKRNKTEAKKTAPQAARDMMATVSEWVNEIHQRQQAETARAIRTLFNEPSALAK